MKPLFDITFTFGAISLFDAQLSEFVDDLNEQQRADIAKIKPGEQVEWSRDIALNITSITRTK